MNWNTVTLIQRDSIAIIKIDNPPVNATSTAVRKDLSNAINMLDANTLKAAILLCEGKTFIAGGDMSEFAHPPQLPHLPDIVKLIEDSPVPIIAAMHGSVLGGGLEIALACAWRIATQGTKFGLPEVNVGLIPGAGGTQLLPRLVGFELAQQLCTSGKPISADTMLKQGGIDSIVDGTDLLEAAIDFAKNLPTRPTKVSERNVIFPTIEALSKIRSELETKSRGQQSPLHNFDALLWSQLPYKEGQKKERKLHLQLRQSDESKALLYAFFAERKVSKPSIINKVQPYDLQNISVIGGGLMGSGIATAMLNGGYNVTLIEQSTTAANKAYSSVKSNLEKAAKRGIITKDTMMERMKNLSVMAELESAKNSDLVIEAIFENLKVKQELFSKLSNIVSKDTILATNTSYLNPTQIFKNTSNQSRCIGIHFFSPAHIMRLAEIVYLPATSNEIIATAFDLAKRLQKVAVLSGICDGFIGNRMLAAYRREAEYLLADGALPHQVDDAMRDFGFAMGPFEAQDMGGLQIAWANRKEQNSARDPKQRYVTIADQVCEQERFGQRSGKGWYNYPDGPRSKTPDKDVEKIIVQYSKSKNIERQQFNKQEIQQRLTAILANEGALIVEEGIAENDIAIDMVKLFGYGFPRWRGGPMHYIEQVGISNISKTLKSITTASPNSWKIAKRFQES